METKVRLIIKRTYQPPIDTPASIQWRTIVVDSPALAKEMSGEDYTTAEVVGAELLSANEVE